MNEEIFDAISEQLDKSGVTVSKKMDGSIIVTLPDSDEILAECHDNADGTLSYTLHLGNDTEESGSGSPAQFKEAVLTALDTWIEFVPYDEFAVEPGISPEYRRSIGESRNDAMLRSLFEMGLDDRQADAIMEAVDALFESTKNVKILVGGKVLEGPSFGEIVKNNLPFVKRQWLLEKLKQAQGGTLDPSVKGKGNMEIHRSRAGP